MKNLLSLGSLLLALVTLSPILAAWTQPADSGPNPSLSNNLELAAMARSKTVKFSAGTLIEIVYLDVIPGSEKTLEETFMPKISSLIKKHGGAVLANFKTVAIIAGDLRASHISIIEWPSFEARTALVNDRAYHDIKPTRDNAAEALKFGFFAVPEDREVTFYEDKVYEFGAALWKSDDPEVIQNELAPRVQEYFSKIGPLIAKYGGREITPLMVHPQAPNEEWVYRPHIALLMEWTSPYAQSKLFEDAEYRKHVHLRDSAIHNLELIHTRIQL